MKISHSLHTTILALSSILLAIITFNIHLWNRVAHNTVGPHTPEEKNIALMIFEVTLLVLYSTPFLLSLFIKDTSDHRKWPIYEIIVIVLGVILGSGVESFLPYDIYIPRRDAVATFLPYVSSISAYSFTIPKIWANWRPLSSSKLLTNLAVMLIAAVLILLVSYIVVYIE